MQEPFSLTPNALTALHKSMSRIRFTKYLKTTGGDQQAALRLYRWNTEISQSLWWPLQSLEVVSRNAIAKILAERFGPDWHLSGKIQKILKPDDLVRLAQAADRQRRERQTQFPSADSVVADMTFGFWTGLLTSRYAVPIGWASRLRKAFPYLPQGCTLQTVWRPMNDIRQLRNRIAHHEPVYSEKLKVRYLETCDLIGWICPDTRWYVEQTSTFSQILAMRPSD